VGLALAKRRGSGTVFSGCVSSKGFDILTSNNSASGDMQDSPELGNGYWFAKKALIPIVTLWRTISSVAPEVTTLCLAAVIACSKLSMQVLHAWTLD